MSSVTPTIAESFFADRVEQRTSRPQLLIATLAGIAFALDMIVVYMNLGEAQPTYGGTVLVLGILYFMTPFLIWVLMTISTFLIARLINARAEVTMLWRTFGWGLAPLIGGGLLLSLGRYLTLSNPCSVLNCDVSQYVRLLAQVEDVYAYAGTALNDTVFLGLFAASIVCFAVTGYFWIIAAYQSTTLTRAGAAIAAGTPSLVIIGAYVLAIL